MSDNSFRTIKRTVKPKAWSVLLKYYVNQCMKRIIGKSIFNFSIYEPFSKVPNWQKKIVNLWNVLNNETNFSHAIGLFFICILILILWKWLAPNSYYDLWVEFVGLTFDVLFILIIFAFFEYKRQRKLSINSQQDIIDDFKLWGSDEAKFRIAGSIRRLNRLGITNIDFGGIKLSNFSFPKMGIKSIRGSTFYDGTWGEMGSRDSVIMENIDFRQVDCRDVVFSKFNPFGSLEVDIVFAMYKNCCFVDSELSASKFDGAHLEWTNEHPAELGVWHDHDEQPVFEQTYWPPFWGVDLVNVSFQDTKLKNVDFRGATGLEQCVFSGARGLETCLFDDEYEYIKKTAMEAAI